MLKALRVNCSAVNEAIVVLGPCLRGVAERLPSNSVVMNANIDLLGLFFRGKTVEQAHTLALICPKTSSVTSRLANTRQ